MSEELPHPPIPPHIDLRTLSYMPLRGALLFDSDFALQATADEFRAAMTLWWKSWHQVPAGSLPNNDASLRGLAGFGRDQASWETVRDAALSGFAECSDGRLYHLVICELALEAFAKMIKAHHRGVKGAAKRWGNAPGNGSTTAQRNDQRNAEFNAHDIAEAELIRSKGREGNIHTPSELEAGRSSPVDNPTPEHVQPRRKRESATERTQRLIAEQRAAIERTASMPEQLRKPASAGKPEADRGQASAAPSHGTRASRPTKMPPWWANPAGIARRGRELDINRGADETPAAYRYRVCERATTGAPPWPWLDVLTKRERKTIEDRALPKPEKP